jgi:hypothetical protein
MFMKSRRVKTSSGSETAPGDFTVSGTIPVRYRDRPCGRCLHTGGVIAEEDRSTAGTMAKKTNQNFRTNPVLRFRIHDEY